MSEGYQDVRLPPSLNKNTKLKEPKGDFYLFGYNKFTKYKLKLN